MNSTPQRFPYQHIVTQYLCEMAALGLASEGVQAMRRLSDAHSRDDAAFVEALTQDLDAQRKASVTG